MNVSSLTNLKSKRIGFLFVSLFLGGLLAFLSLSPYRGEWAWIFSLPCVAVLLTYFALGKPSGIEVITLLFLPVVVAFGAAVNQYFFPNFHLIIKTGSWLAFAVVFYILLLSLNVFRVERVKGEKIPLERAARPIIFLACFLSVFLILTAFYKLGLNAAFSTLMVFLLGFVMAVIFFWFLTLSDLFEQRFFIGAAAVGLGLAQVSLAYSFFPWEAYLRGLSEGVFFYAILGVARAYYEKHLRPSIILEYILLSLAVFLLARFL